MYLISWEPIKTLLQDGLERLVKLHWDEADALSENVKLCVDWNRYERLEQENVIKWAGIRDDKKLVGYCSVCITHPLHCKESLCAMVDTIFLSKEHRRGMIGFKLILCIEKALKEIGVKQITFFSRKKVSKKGGIGILFKRLGYIPFEESFTKYEVAA